MRLKIRRKRGENNVLLRLVVVRDHARRIAGRARDAGYGGSLEAVVGDDLAGDERDFVAALGVIDDLRHVSLWLRLPTGFARPLAGRRAWRALGAECSSLARTAASISDALGWVVSTYKMHLLAAGDQGIVIAAGSSR